MSKGARKLTRRKAILLGLLVLALPTVSVAVWVLWPLGDQQVLMFYVTYKRDLHDIPGVVTSCGSSGTETASAQKQAPRAISTFMRSTVGPSRQDLSRRDKTGDMTIGELSCSLSWATHRPKRLKEVLDWFNARVGRPRSAGSDWTTVSKRTVGESDTLYVRITPEGQFYISTAGDREHMIHAEMLVDDPNLPAAASKICQDHWADWVKKVDELAKELAPDGGRQSKGD